MKSKISQSITFNDHMTEVGGICF
uniref:Uncharacterized protein n=1 Tax=Anguilla anguilla TaxID=7936 RepID=A0A0E9V6G5_ANGAN